MSRPGTKDCPTCLAIWSENYSAEYTRFSRLERNVYLNQAQTSDYRLVPVRLDQTPLDRKIYGNIVSYDAEANTFQEIAAAISDNLRQILPSRKRQSRDDVAHVFNTAPALTRTITGRDADVQDLREAFRTRNAAALTAISGTGGIGKSTLALFYANQFADEYDGIGWIPSETEPELAEGFRRIGRKLGLNFAPDERPGDIIEDTRDALIRDTRRWLLIYDNAADPAAIHDHLVIAPHVHILSTSRHTVWPDIYTSRDVNVLRSDSPDAPAVELLLNESGRSTDREGAMALAADPWRVSPGAGPRWRASQTERREFSGVWGAVGGQSG